MIENLGGRQNQFSYICFTIYIYLLNVFTLRGLWFARIYFGECYHVLRFDKNLTIFYISNTYLMSVARTKAKAFLTLEQISTIEAIFPIKSDREQVFDVLFGYSENRDGPEYYNWRLLLDELGCW